MLLPSNASRLTVWRKNHRGAPKFPRRKLLTSLAESLFLLLRNKNKGKRPRAVCSRSGSNGVGLRRDYPRYFIYHCRGDHWSSENVRLTPYVTAVTYDGSAKALPYGGIYGRAMPRPSGRGGGARMCRRRRGHIPAIRYGYNLTYGIICRKCFAFSNLILSDFFRERSQNQESLHRHSTRRA